MSRAAAPLSGRTFVGFGFGAIQAGLFLYEAFKSGHFARLVVAEVVPETVATLRADHGYYTVNIAHAQGVEQARVGPVEVYDPAVEADRAHLIDAIAAAHELATAVPSINFYVGSGPGSIHRLLASGLARKEEIGGPSAVIYAAENHNHAAEALVAAVRGELPAATAEAALARVCFANTVIGKMSGVVPADASLAAVTPTGERAFLVEEFNRILISRIHFAPGTTPFRRGLIAFAEKDDLLPFEEAKLYGHNALHAMAAYLGGLAGCRVMSELPRVPGLLAAVRAAAIEEPGAALIARYAGLDDLFTPAGFAAYVDDLLTRMVNPWLRDEIVRVGRDPQRKLSWDDRLVGTMRLALDGGIEPEGFALGAAAALKWMTPAATAYPAGVLAHLWQRPAGDGARVAALERLVAQGWVRLHQWLAGTLPLSKNPTILSEPDSIAG